MSIFAVRRPSWLAPLALSLLSGLGKILDVIDADLVRAFITSMAIAAIAATIACLFALALASAARRWRPWRALARGGQTIFARHSDDRRD